MRIVLLIQQYADQYPHRVANIFAALTGGGILTSHWFAVASELARFGANVVSIVTGVAAVIFYVHGIIRRCIESRRARSAS
jgi:hypothetical protein